MPLPNVLQELFKQESVTLNGIVFTKCDHQPDWERYPTFRADLISTIKDDIGVRFFMCFTDKRVVFEFHDNCLYLRQSDYGEIEITDDISIATLNDRFVEFCKMSKQLIDEKVSILANVAKNYRTIASQLEPTKE